MKILFKILKQEHVRILILWGLILSLISIQIYIFQSDFSHPFRKEFMYNLYYHSQWVVPEHIQSIGDDGLYQVAGDQLLQKHNFYEINPEVPPLGKYYYGVAIRILGSAERGALLLFGVAALLYYALLKKYIENPVLQAFAMLFFITDPLLFYQTRVSMLDLPQLVALLGHILCILALIHHRKKSSMLISKVILTGLTLGMFMSIKIGALGLVLIIADALILWKTKKIKLIFPILSVAALTYLATYTMYFVQGHSMIEWLKAQKWMLHFYASSTIQPVYGTVFTTLLAGRNIGWGVDEKWAQVGEWTLSWTALLISSTTILVYRIRKMMLPENEILYLFLLIAGLLASYVILPFFTRYLVLVIPLFLIFVLGQLDTMKKYQNILYSALIILFAVHYYMFWH